MKRLFAVMMIGLYMFRNGFMRLLKAPFIFLGLLRRDQAKRFESNFRDDRIRPMTHEELDSFFEHHRCIRCGACDAVCERAKDLDPIYLGPSYVASTHSRLQPDAVYAKPYLAAFEACRACGRCMNVCPTGVPLTRIANLVIRHAGL